MTPTQRALRDLRELGYTAAVVERWNPFANIRQDLFGMIDIIAINKYHCLGVQATSGSNHSSHVKKMKEAVHLDAWVQPPHRHLEVWSYSKKLRKPGGVAVRYVLRREEIPCNRS